MGGGGEGREWGRRGEEGVGERGEKGRVGSGGGEGVGEEERGGSGGGGEGWEWGRSLQNPVLVFLIFIAQDVLGLVSVHQVIVDLKENQ